MNILLFGSSGLIGKKVIELLQNHSLLTPTSHEIDFAKPTALDLDKIKTLMQNVDIVINMVGIISHDKILLKNVHHHSPPHIAKIAK